MNTVKRRTHKEKRQERLNRDWNFDCNARFIERDVGRKKGLTLPPYAYTSLCPDPEYRRP